MTVYGESVSEFRPRPARLAVASVSGASILIAAACASLVLSAGELLLYRAAAGEMWFLHAPFAINPFLLPADPSPYFLPMRLLVPPPILLIAFLISLFAPTGRGLAGRLITDTFVLGLISMGVAPPLVSLFGPFKGVPDKSSSAHVPQMALAVAMLGISALLILKSERRIVETLGNLFSVETPGHRLRLWAIRLPLPLTALAGLCFLNHHPAAAAACLAVLGVTLFENLAHRPRQNYLELADPELREEAAMMPILAAALIGAQLWAFGFPILRLQRRVLLMSQGQPRLERAFWPSGRVVEGTSRIAPPPGQQAPISKEELKKRIEIRWSKPRKPAAKPEPGAVPLSR